MTPTLTLLPQVLLYNFFGNSPAELSQWRIVLNALEDQHLAVPDFDRNRSRYASICSEVRYISPLYFYQSTYSYQSVEISVCCHYTGPRKYLDS